MDFFSCRSRLTLILAGAGRGEKGSGGGGGGRPSEVTGCKYWETVTPGITLVNRL